MKTHQSNNPLSRPLIRCITFSEEPTNALGNCVLLSDHSVSSGNSLTTFWGELSGPIFEDQEWLTFEDGTEKLPRKVGTELPLLVA